ncbi:MAG: ABC transporter ATP-binding protein [Planctomycetes bacterium]|nr:ABC transporter ATP-binding protein [Planctomycetota bacterium]
MTLLVLALSGLSFVGLGLDVIRHAASHGSVPAPAWPLHLRPPDTWDPRLTVALIAACVLVFALLRALINGWYTVAMSDLTQGRIVVDLRAQIYDKLQRLSFRFYDSNAVGSIINRVTGDVQQTRMFVDGVLMQTLILTISLATYFVYMAFIHLPLTLACLASTPGIFLLARRFSRVVQPAYRRERELFDDLVMGVNEAVNGAAVIKGFAREGHEVARFVERSRRLTGQKQWIFWRATTYPQAISLLTQLNLVVLLAYGGILVVRGELPLGMGMVVFAGLLQQFSAQVSNLANVANSMQQSLTGARRVFEVLDTPVEILSPAAARPLGSDRFEVELRNVTFGYDPAAPVLREVSLVARPGQVVAILGQTGAGKSTLLSLVPRFYDPQDGAVFVEGKDVRDLELTDLRRRVGVVFQESFLFSASIAENIAFGHPEATRGQIEAAAKVAMAHQFIMDLPDGYDTLLREAGSNLSGGQRQRLAIARAVLLEPAILLLDDPTAAVDPQTEGEILDAMESAMAGRTTFVVAHRLGTLMRADTVAMLHRGRIVQTGTHAELMRQGGPYRMTVGYQLADPSAGGQP